MYKLQNVDTYNKISPSFPFAGWWTSCCLILCAEEDAKIYKIPLFFFILFLLFARQNATNRGY